MRRLAVLVALGVLLVPTLSVTTAAGQLPDRARGAFVKTGCPGFFPASRHVDCGYVTVPEDRSRPGGRTIRVEAAVVRASSAHPAADPIVFVDGGPSFGAISPFALGGYFASWPFAHDRDIILVDTRGTGLSKPRLGCPELDVAQVKAVYAGPTIDSRAAEIYPPAITACWKRLVGEGIDPAAYTTAESAADLEALRRALGVPQWNVLAISADGMLGATYVRLFPDHVRSVVFDSGVPPQTIWGPDYDRGTALELQQVFRGCRAVPACRAKYPHVHRRLMRQVHRLAKHPALISIPDFKPHGITLELDGTGVFYDAMSMIYPGDTLTPSHLLDPLEYIWRISHGELGQVYRELFGTGPATNGHADDYLAQGKTLSYACHDFINFITDKNLRAAARALPAEAPRYLGPHFDLGHGFAIPVSPAGCREWPVGRAPHWQHQPLRSAVPALVLAGEYDASIPPYVAHGMVRRLSHGYYYEMPASSHLQLEVHTNGHGCARAIAAAFLTDPTTAPDSSCLASVPPADFTPRAGSGRLPPIRLLFSRWEGRRDR